MSNEDINKKVGDSKVLDLKLNGDKIKLETRPCNGMQATKLSQGLIRSSSAVPSLHLYCNEESDVNLKPHRPFSASHLPFRPNPDNCSVLTGFEDISIENLEQDNDLPSTHIFKHLISEPIKSYRTSSECKKHNNKESHDTENSSSFAENLAVEIKPDNDFAGTKCILNPGLTTKPPIPRKCELKSQNRFTPKENNMLNDNEIEIIRLKTQKFEEDFENKYKKNDLANETMFNSQEIMSEREFNSFLDKTQNDMEKNATEEFIKNYANFKKVGLSVNEDEDMNPTNHLYGHALSDRTHNIEAGSTDILTSKNDNEILLSKSDNWLFEDDYAAHKVSKSEQRTDTLLKNFRNQHAEIEKCINKAQSTLEKTKKCSSKKPKNCDEQDILIQEHDNVDLKFNKFFQHPQSSEKPPKGVLKDSNSKCSDAKTLNRNVVVNKKKDKLNNMNEAKRNRLKFTENTPDHEGEESWMSKFPCQDEEYYNEIKDVELPNFSTTIVHETTDNNSKVNKWLESDRLSINSGKNTNFMEILENVEDLDVVTRVNDQEILHHNEHDNENKTEASESNTYDDIVHILEVLEEEDRKSHMKMESIKDIVNQELQLQRKSNDVTNVSHNIPLITVTDSSRSNSVISKSSDQGIESTSSLTSCASNYNQILSFLDEVDRNSSKTLTSAKERVQHVTQIINNAIRLDTIPKPEDLMPLHKEELCDQIVDLNLRLKDKTSSIKLLQEELSSVRNQVLNLTQRSDEIVKQKLKAQKEEHEATIKRHQKFIDQLITDKKSLNQQCESLINEVKTIEDRYASNMKAMEHKHQVELKKMKEMHMAGEKIRRERWIDSKTQKIKELTVKSIEPELQNMTIRHQQEICDLRALHKKELEDLELKAARRTQQQLEALREQLAEERDKAIAHEKELMRQRYENLAESEEKAYQEQRRRLQQEHTHRILECEEREKAAIVEKDRTIKQVQEEFENKLQTAIRRHQSEIKVLKESMEMETEAWKNNYRKQQTIQLIEKEAKLRDQFKKDRDREIEEVIERLETESTETRIQIEQATENRIRRLKEKFENEIRDLEQSEKDVKAKYATSKTKIIEYEDTIIELKANVKQLEAQLTQSKQALDRMNIDRSKLKEIVRGEVKQDIASLEKEVAKLREEKDKELQQVYSRVKIAVAKKDEILSELTRDHTALQEKCIYLENMLQQKTKECLIK